MDRFKPFKKELAMSLKQMAQELLQETDIEITGVVILDERGDYLVYEPEKTKFDKDLIAGRANIMHRSVLANSQHLLQAPYEEVMLDADLGRIYMRPLTKRATLLVIASRDATFGLLRSLSRTLARKVTPEVRRVMGDDDN
ncbi:roadblock/LC7 domain-containing protein [Magnetococcales bacterium HHB-1]